MRSLLNDMGGIATSEQLKEIQKFGRIWKLEEIIKLLLLWQKL